MCLDTCMQLIVTGSGLLTETRQLWIGMQQPSLSMLYHCGHGPCQMADRLKCARDEMHTAYKQIIGMSNASQRKGTTARLRMGAIRYYLTQ
jgi:hypothetical protein